MTRQWRELAFELYNAAVDWHEIRRELSVRKAGFDRLAQHGHRKQPSAVCHPPTPPSLKPSSPLYTQRHNTVNNIVVVLLQRLDSLLPAHARLRHHELDVLGLQARVIHLLAVVLFLLSGLLVLDGLALVTAVGRTVIVAGMLVGGLRGELLGCGGLGLGVEVLDLGFAEDAVSRSLASKTSVWCCG